jgi:hypothetical protein
MTSRAEDDERSTLAWVPGHSGLVAVVSPHGLPMVDERALSPDARRLHDDALHITLLRRRSLQPWLDALAPSWPDLARRLPTPPPPRFDPRLRCARRPPHPTKDPATETRERLTWFFAVGDQEQWRRALEGIVTALADALGAALTHPEPGRFFHLSLYNNRGGDPARSIGDIRADDECPPAPGVGTRAIRG